MRHAGLPGVILPIPPGWEDRSQLIIVSGEGADFRANIVVVNEELKDRSLEEFIDHQIGTLRETFDGFSLQLEEPASFGPHRGHLIDYGFVAAGKSYRQRQFMVVAQGLVYTFTYSNTAADFDPGLALLEQVASNARIMNQQRGPDVFGLE